MTTNAENKIIRQLFDKNKTYYFNDKRTSVRRKIFKSFTATPKLCKRVVTQLEKQGIQGWQVWSGATTLERYYRFGNHRQNGIVKREALS